MRLFDQIDELYKEAMRAPSHYHAGVWSWYAFERWKKNKLGWTREERIKVKAELKEKWEKAKHEILVEKSIVKSEPSDVYEKELVEIRKKLGYKNPEETLEAQIEMAFHKHDKIDPVFTFKEWSKARESIDKSVTDIFGVTKEDMVWGKVVDNEAFKWVN